MRFSDDNVVWASFDGDLRTKPEAFEVRLGWMAQEHIGGDLGVLRQLLLVRARSDELQRAKEARRVAHREQLFGILSVALTSGRPRHRHLEVEGRVAERLHETIPARTFRSSFGEVLSCRGGQEHRVWSEVGQARLTT